VQVNAVELQTECEMLGVQSMPWFTIWAAGKITHSFSCNLTTISELRRSLGEILIHTAAAPFHAGSGFIAELRMDTPPLVIQTPGGSLARPGGKSSRGPPGAVSGISRLPSIDDLTQSAPTPPGSAHSEQPASAPPAAAPLDDEATPA
jgi:hypothetical protein